MIPKAPRKLVGQELQDARKALKQRVAELKAANTPLRPDSLREQVEPILLHCFVTKSLQQTSDYLAEFGVNWSRQGLGSLSRRWNLSRPGNTKSAQSGRRSGNWGYSGALGQR